MMAGVAALAVSAMAFVPISGASADSGVSQFCAANGDFGGNHGQCTSIVQNAINNGNAEPVAFCKFIDLVITPINRGQCVSSFRHFL